MERRERREEEEEEEEMGDGEEGVSLLVPGSGVSHKGPNTSPQVPSNCPWLTGGGPRLSSKPPHSKPSSKYSKCPLPLRPHVRARGSEEPHSPHLLPP